MSDIFRDFGKKNEVPKVKIPKFATGGICNDAIFPKFDAFSQIDEIVKDITKKKDNAIAMEFTKCIGELLKKNGVVPKMTEYTRNFETENTFETRYGVSIDELDFSEQDKAFEDKIAKLEEELKEWKAEAREIKKNRDEQLKSFRKAVEPYIDIGHMHETIAELKQRIAELESMEMETCEKEPISDDCRPSMEWYENRHQSDCIEINRLNTTIDVLIHKVEYLRQFAGLE